MDANSLSDLERRLQNLIRVGVIFEVQHANPPRVRVRLGNEGGIETEFLPWITARAGETRNWCPPTVGEQVVVFSPGGDLLNGLALPAINSDSITPPDTSATTHVVSYPDGARVSYDHSSGHMEISGIKTLSVIAAEKILFDVPESEFTGNVTIDGNLLTKGWAKIMGLLTYLSGLSGTGGAGGKTQIAGDIQHTSGTIQTDGDMLAGNISLKGHRHKENGQGGGVTDGAMP